MNKREDTTERLFIGGASRSGTVLMSRILHDAALNIAVLPIEGWVRPRIQLNMILPRAMRKQFLIDYLTDGRFVDIKRHESKSPIEFFKTSLNEIAKDIPRACQRPSELIDWVLKKFAHETGKLAWGIKDTYLELEIKRFLKIFPRSKFIIMIRDPRASLCSELYFGTYPQRNNNPSSNIVHRLCMWGMSVRVALLMKEKHPSKVALVRYEDLISDPQKVKTDIEATLDIQLGEFHGNVFDKSFSTYGEQGKTSSGFYDGTKEWQKLLSAEEIYLIDSVAKPYLSACKYTMFFYGDTTSSPVFSLTSWILILYIRILICASSLAPRFMRYVCGISFRFQRTFVVLLSLIKRYARIVLYRALMK